jgi:hypothetical protein
MKWEKATEVTTQQQHCFDVCGPKFGPGVSEIECGKRAIVEWMSTEWMSNRGREEEEEEGFFCSPEPRTPTFVWVPIL